MGNNFEKRIAELGFEMNGLNSMIDSMNNMAKSYSDHYKEVNDHYTNLINEFEKFKKESQNSVQAKGIFINEDLAIKVLQTLAYANQYCNIGDPKLTEEFASLISKSNKYNKEQTTEQTSHKCSCGGKCHSKDNNISKESSEKESFKKGSSKIDLDENIKDEIESDAEEYANDIINLIGHIFGINDNNLAIKQNVINELKKQFKK